MGHILATSSAAPAASPYEQGAAQSVRRASRPLTFRRGTFYFSVAVLCERALRLRNGFGRCGLAPNVRLQLCTRGVCFGLLAAPARRIGSRLRDLDGRETHVGRLLVSASDRLPSARATRLASPRASRVQRRRKLLRVALLQPHVAHRPTQPVIRAHQQREELLPRASRLQERLRRSPAPAQRRQEPERQTLRKLQAGGSGVRPTMLGQRCRNSAASVNTSSASARYPRFRPMRSSGSASISPCSARSRAQLRSCWRSAVSSSASGATLGTFELVML